MSESDSIEGMTSTGDVAIERLHAAPWNPRQIKDVRFQNLVRSLQADPGFLQHRPILATADGTIYAGNMRYRAAQHLGMATVPAIIEDIPEQLAKERALRDNAQWGEWTEQDLAELIYELGEAGSDTSLLGFDSDEIARLMASVGAIDEPLTDPDAVPEMPAEPTTKPGDLWLLGDHRVLCGDSTSATDVERLMDGETAAAVFTSPPYLQQRTYEGNMAPDWDALMVGVVDAMLPVLADDAQLFVNLGLVHRDGVVIRYWDSMVRHIESANWPLFGWYVWDKLNGMPGDWNGRLSPAHEWIFHFAREHSRPAKTVASKSAGSNAGRTRTQRNPDGTMKKFTADGAPTQPVKIPDSVIRLVNQGSGGLGHTAPFPVRLPTVFVEAWQSAGLWYEPFCGSGTTLIACEQLGRKCYGMEIEPKYVDVIVRRWEEFTGRKAVLDGTPD